MTYEKGTEQRNWADWEQTSVNTAMNLIFSNQEDDEK